MSVMVEDVLTIVKGVWESFFEMSAAESDDAKVALTRPVPTFTGVVQITGAWEGAVCLRCTSEVARTVGAHMFGLDEGDTSMDDIQDAVGEVANMIGGNVKSLLPEPSKLSLPTVSEGTDYGISIPGSSVVCELSLTCPAGYFEVTVREKSDPATVKID